jgi:hypothetical protein
MVANANGTIAAAKMTAIRRMSILIGTSPEEELTTSDRPPAYWYRSGSCARISGAILSAMYAWPASVRCTPSAPINSGLPDGLMLFRFAPLEYAAGRSASPRPGNRLPSQTSSAIGRMRGRNPVRFLRDEAMPPLG